MTTLQTNEEFRDGPAVAPLSWALG
eukprot:COSAG04_NODE_27299_length_284_cov_1.156757_1_plen_24_part_10